MKNTIAFFVAASMSKKKSFITLTFVLLERKVHWKIMTFVLQWQLFSFFDIQHTLIRHEN